MLFATKRYLRQHVASKHGGSGLKKGHACEVCDKVEMLKKLVLQVIILPAATARWAINAVSTPAHKTIEHGSIEINELNGSYESYDSY